MISLILYQAVVCSLSQRVKLYQNCSSFILSFNSPKIAPKGKCNSVFRQDKAQPLRTQLCAICALWKAGKNGEISLPALRGMKNCIQKTNAYESVLVCVVVAQSKAKTNNTTPGWLAICPRAGRLKVFNSKAKGFFLSRCSFASPGASRKTRDGGS